MNNGHVFPKAQNIVRVLLPTVSTIQDTIIKDHPKALGAFLVALIFGSDKKTVATGHTCYWPLYLLVGNIHNNVCHGH